MKRRRVISLTTAGCIGALSGSVVLGVSSGIIGGTYQDNKVSVKENASKTDYKCDGEVQYTLTDFNEEQLITRAILT
jgi:hypothetical protein